MLLDDAVELMKALAEPSRLRMLTLLHEHGSLCVREFEQVLELPQYHVSRHLGILRRLGLVTTQRDGPRMNYHLNPTLDRRCLALLAEAVNAIGNDPQIQLDQDFAGDVRPSRCRRIA